VWQQHSGAALPWSGVASWWSRAGGVLIDQALCAVALGPLLVLFAILGLATWVLGDGPGPSVVASLLVWTGIVAAITGPYYVLTEWLMSGQTLGKMALRIRVVDAVTAGPISARQAVVRWLVRFVLWVPLPLFTFGLGLLVAALDALWPLWDDRRQALHDKLAGTIAVAGRPQPWS
jgi:uncharacterized RDD family membrane protein YckC